MECEIILKKYQKFIKEINEVGILTKGSGYVDVKKYLLKSKNILEEQPLLL